MARIVPITCRIYNWRGMACLAHHFYVILEDESGKPLADTKFDTYEEVKYWAIHKFLELFDMRTHTLNIIYIEAQGNTYNEMNWKDCNWLEEYWKKTIRISKGV